MTVWIRQLHRWLSVAFTLTVIANFVALGMGVQTPTIGYLALPPLFLLLFSGIYLFVLPYLGKGKATAPSRLGM